MNENEQQQKFIKAVKEADRILVVADPANQEAHLGGAALTLGLRQLGKQALLSEASSLPFWAAQDWAAIDADTGQIKDLVITIKNEADQVGEIRYEKELEPQQAVKIFVKPQRQAINPKEVVVASIEPGVDLIILVGIGNAEQLERFKEKYFSLFVKAQVVALGVKASEQEIANSCWRLEQADCLGQAVEELFRKLEPSSEAMDQAFADVLLASLIQATANFQNEQATAPVLKLAAELVERGGKIQRAGELVQLDLARPDFQEVDLSSETKAQQEPFETAKLGKPANGAILKLAAQLTERNGEAQFVPEPEVPARPAELFEGLLRRSRLNENRTLRWLLLDEQEAANFLPEEDFIKLTGKLAALVPPAPHNLLLANLASGNPHPAIKGWLKSPAKTVLNELANLLNGFIFNDVLTFPIRAQSLQDAERKILKLAEAVFDK